MVNRLFPGSILYCEGRLKPLFRGKLHALGVLVVCPYWFLGCLAHLDKWPEVIGLAIFFMGLIFCWSCSALYHTKKCTIEEEIFLQRLDHCSIFVCLACSITPLSVIHINNHIFGRLAPLLLINWLCCGYGIWHVFNKQQQITTPAMAMILSMFPAYLFLTDHLTNYESLLGLSSLCLFTIASLLYAKRVLNPFPSVFGFHEVFHFSTMVAAYLKFAMYLSISKSLEDRCSYEYSSSNIIFKIGYDLLRSSDICKALIVTV